MKISLTKQLEASRAEAVQLCNRLTNLAELYAEMRLEAVQLRALCADYAHQAACDARTIMKLKDRVVAAAPSSMSPRREAMNAAREAAMASGKCVSVEN